MSLALLCLLIVIYPLFAGPGPVHTRGGGDSPFLLIRLEQLVAGLRAGAFPVRWMPDAAYGLGYPFFNFYAALPYYVAAVFRLLGWGPILSLQFTQALGFVLAAAATALLARRVFRHPAAVTLAVVAYTCAPFHLVNVYVRGDSLSEFYAFVFYPLIFWTLLRLRDHPSWPNVAWLALSYGGLILTHNLSAAIFTPFAIGYALLLAWQPNRKRASNRSPLSAIEVRRNAPQPRARRSRANRRLDWSATWRMVAGIALGLALSACLWFTTLDDLDAVWMGHKAIQTSGYFNYEGHLRGRDLVQPALLFDYDVAPGNTPFAMGAMQAALVLVGVLVLGMGWLRRDRTGDLGSRASPAAGFWIAGFALCTFMITSASKCLWDHLPVLPIVQFPWRFLSVQALFGALIVGELAQRLPRPWWVAAICTLLLTTCAVGGLRPEYLPIQETDVTPERLALFESFTANVGTTIRGEYLPSEVEPQPFASTVTLHRGQKPPPAILAGQVAQATLVERDALSERWRVTVSSEQAHLAFYTFYFPGCVEQRTDVPPRAGRRTRGHLAVWANASALDRRSRVPGRTRPRRRADLALSPLGKICALDPCPGRHHWWDRNTWDGAAGRDPFRSPMDALGGRSEHGFRPHALFASQPGWYRFRRASADGRLRLRRRVGARRRYLDRDFDMEAGRFQPAGRRTFGHASGRTPALCASSAVVGLCARAHRRADDDPCPDHPHRCSQWTLLRIAARARR